PSRSACRSGVSRWASAVETRAARMKTVVERIMRIIGLIFGNDVHDADEDCDCRQLAERPAHPAQSLAGFRCLLCRLFRFADGSAAGIAPNFQGTALVVGFFGVSGGLQTLELSLRSREGIESFAGGVA